MAINRNGSFMATTHTMYFDDGQLRRRLVSILRDPAHRRAIRNDLQAGFSALSEWMREIVRDLLRLAESA
jgi:hypothetical protein